MPRATVARIDLAAIRHNFGLARQFAGGARAMAVIKADAYGHGIARVARTLAPDATCFAVACIEEALAIRDAGLAHPVVLLQGCMPQATSQPAPRKISNRCCTAGISLTGWRRRLTARRSGSR